MKRRKILSATSFATVVGLSGCISNRSESDEDQSNSDSTSNSNDGLDDDSSDETNCSETVIIANVDYDEESWNYADDAEVDVTIQNTGNSNAEVTIIVTLLDRVSAPFDVEKTVGVPAGEVKGVTVRYGRLSSERSPDTLAYSDTKVESECVDSLDDISSSEDTREESRSEEERVAGLVESALEENDEDDDDD